MVHFLLLNVAIGKIKSKIEKLETKIEYFNHILVYKTAIINIVKRKVHKTTDCIEFGLLTFMK